MYTVDEERFISYQDLPFVLPAVHTQKAWRNVLHIVLYICKHQVIPGFMVLQRSILKGNNCMITAVVSSDIQVKKYGCVNYNLGMRLVADWE